MPPGGENALASKEFLERHQVTAPKIKVPAGSSSVQLTGCPAGEGRGGKGCHSIPGKHEWQGTFLSQSGTRAALETQTQKEALKVTQYTNSASENDSRLTSDASVLERTEQKRVKGRNDPGSLEICVTKHQPLRMFSVYLGRVQLNLGC